MVMAAAIVKKKGFISTRKAANLLGVAVSTIQLWTDNGILNAWVTNGGHRRIALDSVEAILLKQKKVEKTAHDTIIQNKAITILLVEDSQSQMDLYRQQFKVRGLDVNLIEADNGYIGMIKIGQYQPSIIITDLMMPDTDGFQMLKALKHTTELNNTLIIVVSALSLDEVDKMGGLPEGVIFYSKPIPFDNLENVILKKILNYS